MKGILIVLLMSISVLITNAQKSYSYVDTPLRIDSISNGLIYTETIDVNGTSKETLFERSKLFVFKSFGASNNNMLESKDSDIWRINVTGKIKVDQLDMNNLAMTLLTDGQQMSYKLNLQLLFKDNRFKYLISDIILVNEVTKLEIQIDQSIRKNPAAFQKKLDKGLSQNEYDKFMGKKNLIMVFINDLKKAIMNDTVISDF